MRPESRMLLGEMEQAASAVAAFSAGRSFEELASDDMFRSAIYLKFILIGEALAKLKRVDEPSYERISEAWRIVGFRNQIVHGYAKLEDTITWQIIQDKLPVLRAELAALLGEP